MPLGLFSSGKAQVLTDEKPAGSKKKEPKQLSENKCKGVTLKLDNTRVTIEKQIAEGGFAIVYIAVDKKNKKYALKRQFTKDNQKQLDACCREHSFLKQCLGHKNIVEFVDSYVTCLGNGIWECMMLTAYHQKNVLQLMNERIAVNQYLTNDEILSIFCDMCEAVSHIHNKQQPIIHRDLKVENVLISSSKPPNYILCDFGSATITPLNVQNSSVEYVKAEVETNTTMCYRSPEMIDLYSGQEIGVKSDIWALGVMLYRLCYFSVPFEESALAIQSVNYQFPSFPAIPDEIKAIIYMLLDVDVARRPTITFTTSLAFEAHRKALPTEINRRKIAENCAPLENCVRMMKENKTPRNRRESSPQIAILPTKPLEATTPSGAPVVAPTPPRIPPTTTTSGETSVAPRLRPKATTIVPNVPSISPVPHLTLQTSKPDDSTTQPDGVFKKSADNSLFQHRQSFSGEERLKASENSAGGPLSCPLMQPADLGFTDLDKPALPRTRAQTDGKRHIPFAAESIFQQQHRRNVSDTSQISRSAFKPYSSQQSSQVRSVEDMSNNRGATTTTTSSAGEWNPFLAAPFSNSVLQKREEEDGRMDDSHFGMVFDEIRRRGPPIDVDNFSDTSSIDSRDPFGAAPFDQLTVSTSSSAAPIAPGSGETEDDERQLISESEEDEVEPTNEQETTEQVVAPPKKEEEDSEIDEQRMNDRRRYSYENIDGVGDDASSDSRGKTDRDDSEEEEDDDDSRRGGDTSHDEDSQNTVGSEDGEGGSRPLLEDDGLEDDDDHELICSFSSSSASNFPPLFVGTSTPMIQNPANPGTNPFLRDELTPKMVSPGILSSVDDDWDLGDRWTDRRDTVFERPPHGQQVVGFAPATLPRQVTPLVCRFKPDLPTTAPVSIIPSMSNTSFPEAVYEPEAPSEPVIGTLISVGAPTDAPTKIPAVAPTNAPFAAPTSAPTNAPTKAPADAPKKNFKPRNKGLKYQIGKISEKRFEKMERDFVKKEQKKMKKREEEEAKKEKDNKKSTVKTLEREEETDGSEAEMWQRDALGASGAEKKKKKSTFGLRSSQPTIPPSELQFVAPIPSSSSSKKSSKDKKSSSSAVKKSSLGNVNSSFVNTSFQPEDPETPSKL